MEILRLIGYGVSLYIALGILVAAAMHVRGLRRIDSSTIGAGFIFRILITPGLVALWPILFMKIVRGGGAGSLESPVSPRGLRRLHGSLIGMIAFAIPIIAGIGLWNRPASVREALEVDLHADDMVRITRSRMDNTAVVVAHVPQELAAPRLVYWAPTVSNNPDDRILLRAIDGFGTFAIHAPDGHLPDYGMLSVYAADRGTWETTFDLGSAT